MKARTKNAIENSSEQFLYEPVIENKNNFTPFNKFIVSGMGGSHLAADLLLTWKPKLDIIIHKDYGLPPISEIELASRLYIASSYSGNTEEVIDGLQAALDKNMAVLIVSVGGKLLEIAKERSLSYIQLPETGIQPRNALGFSFRALLKAIGEEDALRESERISELKIESYETQGKELADTLHGFVPVIYASTRNRHIALNWKIKFNETAKIPAFYNFLPELNHNEMTGFDAKDKNRSLSDKFRFIFLEDKDAHPQIQKRMEILKKLYKDRGFRVQSIPLTGENEFFKIFSSLVLADWTAYYTALGYDIEPNKTPMVEEFKKLIA